MDEPRHRTGSGQRSRLWEAGGPGHEVQPDIAATTQRKLGTACRLAVQLVSRQIGIWVEVEFCNVEVLLGQAPMEYKLEVRRDVRP